jgi:hypothetical protein
MQAEGFGEGLLLHISINIPEKGGHRNVYLQADQTSSSLLRVYERLVAVFRDRKGWELMK